MICAHVVLTLKALQFRYFLTRLVSDSMVKYHGPALSGGQTLQGEQITQRNVGGDAQPYYTLHGWKQM